MNNQASRVAVVNQIARQLMHSGHPSEKDIKAQQDKLNTRQVPASIGFISFVGNRSWRCRCCILVILNHLTDP